LANGVVKTFLMSRTRDVQ